MGFSRFDFLDLPSIFAKFGYCLSLGPKLSSEVAGLPEWQRGKPCPELTLPSAGFSPPSTWRSSGHWGGMLRTASPVSPPPRTTFSQPVCTPEVRKKVESSSPTPHHTTTISKIVDSPATQNLGEPATNV